MQTNYPRNLSLYWRVCVCQPVQLCHACVSLLACVSDMYCFKSPTNQLQSWHVCALVSVIFFKSSQIKLRWQIMIQYIAACRLNNTRIDSEHRGGNFLLVVHLMLAYKMHCLQRQRNSVVCHWQCVSFLFYKIQVVNF